MSLPELPINSVREHMVSLIGTANAWRTTAELAKHFERDTDTMSRKVYVLRKDGMCISRRRGGTGPIEYMATSDAARELVRKPAPPRVAIRPVRPSEGLPAVPAVAAAAAPPPAADQSVAQSGALTDIYGPIAGSAEEIIAVRATLVEQSAPPPAYSPAQIPASDTAECPNAEHVNAFARLAHDLCDTASAAQRPEIVEQHKATEAPKAPQAPTTFGRWMREFS